MCINLSIKCKTTNEKQQLWNFKCNGLYCSTLISAQSKII